MKADFSKENLSRRAFFKKLAGASVGVSAGMVVPKTAHAGLSDCYIPDFEAALTLVVKELIDYFSGDWLDSLQEQMGKYSEFIGENTHESNKTLGITSAKLGDAKNQTESTIAKEKLNRDTAPAPHDCGSKAIGESVKELLGAAKTSNKKIVSDFNTLNNKASVKANYKRILKNRARVKKVIDEGRIDAVEGANFYSERGYTDIEVANEVLESVMGNVAIVPDHSDSVAIDRNKTPTGLRYIAAKDAHNATVNLIYDNLSHVMTRRTPSLQVLDFMLSSSEEDMKKIIEAKSFSNGLSLVDLEQLEIDRTHFNEVWRQDIRRGYASDTPLMEELNKLQSFNNYLDNSTRTLAERNNQLLGAKQMLLMKIKDANG